MLEILLALVDYPLQHKLNHVADTPHTIFAQETLNRIGIAHKRKFFGYEDQVFKSGSGALAYKKVLFVCFALKNSEKHTPERSRLILRDGVFFNQANQLHYHLIREGLSLKLNQSIKRARIRRQHLLTQLKPLFFGKNGFFRQQIIKPQESLLLFHAKRRLMHL
jgi:hypothetical protein